MNETPSDNDGGGPLPLFATREAAKLAGMAAAAGFIAVGTIVVEILTGRLPAQMLGYSTGFVSLPIGAAAPILTALTARSNLKFSLPGLVLSVVYWGLFAIYL